MASGTYHLTASSPPALPLAREKDWTPLEKAISDCMEQGLTPSETAEHLWINVGIIEVYYQWIREHAGDLESA